MTRRASLAALLLALAAPGAAAHAVLLDSDPAQGARLAFAPGEAWVRLTEPVDAGHASLQVYDAAGEPVGVGPVRVEPGANPRLARSLPPDLPEGAYEAVWTALSKADGHTTSGSVGFAVGDFEPPRGDQPDVGRASFLAAASRALAYAGLAIGLGGALFAARAALDPGARRRLAAGCLAIGAAAHLAGVLLLAIHTHAEAGLDGGSLRSSAVGRILAARAVAGAAALAFAAAALGRPACARAAPWTAAGLLALAGLGSARLGHGSLEGAPIIALDFLHLLSVAAWTGGLAAFSWVLLRPRPYALDEAAARETGRRFGTVALLAVTVLAATGIVVAIAILGPVRDLSWSALLGSAYGRFLAAKVGLALAMVGLAAVNRYAFVEPPAPRGLAAWVQRRMAQPAAHGPDARPRFGRWLAAEASVGAAILVLAALLTSVSPPQAAAAVSPPFTAQAIGESFHATLGLEPRPAAGSTSEVRLDVARHDGTPVAGNTCGRDSCLTLRVAAAGGQEAVHVLVPLGGGAWTVDGGLLWVRPGPHEVRLDVQTSDVYLDSLAFAVDVA